jgi:replicative DNA helicase
MLRHNPAIDEVVQLQMLAEHFYFDAHQKIFRAIVDIRNGGRPVDLVILGNEITARKQLDDVGGISYLADLWDAAPTGANVRYYANIVLSKAAYRRIIHAAVELAQDAYDQALPAEELLGAAQAKFDAIHNRTPGAGAHHGSVLFNKLLDEIDARRSGIRHAGLPTGIVTLDNRLGGGFGTSDLVILAARPSVGKTALALAISRNIVADGKPVLFVSLEQGGVELMERLTASVSTVPGVRMREGNLTDAEAMQISEAGGPIRNWPLWVSDRRGQSAAQIAACVRAIHRESGGLAAVVVDYLQLVGQDDPKANRNEHTGGAARRLRDLAGDLRVPVILLCQVNRAGASETEAPKLHHLRDSGEIEQHADAVLMLHPKRRAQNYGEPDVIEVNIAKQRNGPLGVVELEHYAATYEFREPMPPM